MKKILYIAWIVLFVSCDNLLNVEPEIQVSYNNYYKTEQDLEVTMYQTQFFINNVGGAGSQAKIGDIMETTSTLEHSWDPTNIVGGNGMGTVDWTMIYWVIYEANTLLDNMHNAKDNVTPERMDFYRAQACFAKAWAYFYLSRQWGEVPITRNSYSSETYGKKSVLEVLDTVIANAKKAYDILPVQEAVVDRNGVVINSKQFGSKGNACALLAHAYAWKGSMIDLLGLDGDAGESYNKSIEFASYLINGKAGNYSLVRNPENLCKLFSNNEVNNPESIFEYTLDMESEDVFSAFLFGKSYIGFPVNPQISASDHKNKKDTKISFSTIKELYDESDLRPHAYFHRYSYYNLDSIPLMWENDTISEAQKQENRENLRKEIVKMTGGYAYPYKWRTPILKANAYNPNLLELKAIKSNYSYWRLSEIYLLRAECYAKIGENGLAEADLNEIRSFNQAKAYPNSRGDEKGLKYAIFHERERELLMEGHRFYDIIRNGMEYINTYLPGAFRKMTLSDVRSGAIFYPIHVTAFERNDLLRQNIYWAQFMN